MSAALVTRPNVLLVELKSLNRTLTSFRGPLQPITRALRNHASAPVRAATALGGLRSGATSAATQLQQIRARADGAGRSMTKTGRTAATAGSGIRSAGSRAKGVGAALGSLAADAISFDSVVGLLGPAVGPLVQTMTALGGALAVASVAVTAVNVAMRANPLGFVLGLVVPLIAAIITYAVNTETGRRLMKQVFDHVLKTFREILKYLGPVVRAYGSAVGACFQAVGIIVTSAVQLVGSVVSGDLGKARGAISRATEALSSLVRRPWNAFRSAVRPTLDWITGKIPGMFVRVRDATSNTLHGMGDLMSTGLQTLAGVITGPVKGLIAFANWVIDGLNSLSGEFLGKKFGIKLAKIPQLAEGGVVDPSRTASAVRPLSALDRLRPAEPSYRGSPATHPTERGRLHTYHEPEGRSALAVADDLLFLHRTAA